MNLNGDGSFKNKKKRMIYATDSKANNVYKLPSDSAYKQGSAEYAANERRRQLGLDDGGRSKEHTQKATIEIDDAHLVRRDHPRKSMSYAKAKGNTIMIGGQHKFVVLSQGDASAGRQNFTEPPNVQSGASAGFSRPGAAHKPVHGADDTINGGD